MTLLVLTITGLSLVGLALLTWGEHKIRQQREGSRTAAIRQLLQRHASENRLQVRFPASDKREVVHEWTLHRARLQAKQTRRRA